MRDAVMVRHRNGLDVGRGKQCPRLVRQRLPIVCGDDHPAGKQTSPLGLRQALKPVEQPWVTHRAADEDDWTCAEVQVELLLE